MALFTAVATGNFTASSTWDVGSGYPLSGDTYLIPNAYAVTADANINPGAGTIEGSLLLASGVTYTAAGAIVLGNGASKDGRLSFGPSTTLALGANTLTLNNCKLDSTATTDNWAYITGSGAISRGAVYASPKQEIYLRYVSIQTTGAVTLGGGGTSGTYTNKRDIQNCTLVGTGAITIGQSGYSAEASSDTIINACDIENPTGNIRLTGYAGVCTGQRKFTNCTVTCSTSRTFDCQNVTSGWDLTGTVMHNVINGTWNSGANLLDYVFWGMSSGSGQDCIRFSDSKPASTFKRSYIYAEQANAHQIGSTIGSGGSGTHVFQDLVFETIYNTDQANLINIGNLPVEISGVLALKSGALANVVNAVTGGGGITLSRNTIYKTTASDTGGSLLHTEAGAGLTDYDGTINTNSNLISGTASVAVLYGTLDTTDPAGTIATALNNGFYNVTNKYDHTVTTNTGEVDLVASPNFVDPTRDLATWDAYEGSGTGTAVAGINYLLKKNGFNSTTKIQSDTQSVKSVIDLLAWVRAGYAPQNTSLDNTGYGGVDIGAIDVSIPASSGGTSFIRRGGRMIYISW